MRLLVSSYFFLFIVALSLKFQFLVSRQMGSVVQYVSLINSLQNSWRAGINHMAFLNEADIRKRLGVKFKPKAKSGRRPQARFQKYLNKIPKNFDVRQKWPKCTSMKNVPDQSSCGSCWAVATAAAFADRVCVASKQTKDRLLSAQELMTCCLQCSDGEACEGGDPELAFDYIRKKGIVTGGNYSPQYGCKPYLIAPCSEDECEEAKSGKCRQSCTNPNYNISYNEDKVYSGKMIYLGNDVETTQKALMKYGSVVAVMIVLKDFIYYKEGIYRYSHTNISDFIGLHAVRVLGWGSENHTNYWLASNSWNTTWGENGLFRIDRQYDGSYFGDFMTSIPKL